MKNKTKIEFVSYDGKYPCLCHGEFKVKIDGKLHCFHYRYGEEDYKKNCYPDFWGSGGHVQFSHDYSDYDVGHGAWEEGFIPDNLPKKIKDLIPELLDVFNENVPQGCCGGCV